MLDDKKMQLLEQTFKRIFALPIKRSTFRELQNSVATILHGEKEDYAHIFESLLTGRIKQKGEKKESDPRFKAFIEEYLIQTRLAKDILERGEFISMITSDTLNQTNQTIFVHRIRRIDGEEFQFITDPDSTFHILKHLIDRIQDLEKNEASKKVLDDYKEELKSIQEKLERLLS